MEDIKLSVIIPCYNAEPWVLKAIQSVPCRSDIEIIVIDDCSTDGSWSELKLYHFYSKQNIVLLHNDSNMGVGYTVNRGYDVAQGEYVVLLGADDYFVNLNNAMDLLDGTDLIYFSLEINDGTFFIVDEKSKYDYCGSTKFMRRKFVSDTRCPEIRAREDYYFYQELMKKNPTEKYIDKEVMYKHYFFPREGSLTWNACHK